MEVGGLIIGVANLMDPLIRLGRGALKSWQQSKNFGVNAERLRVQFNHERRQVEAMKGLLLAKLEGLGFGKTVFEQFSDIWQAELLDELRQLAALTRDLEEIESRHHIFSVARASPVQGQPPTEEIVGLALAENREAELQKGATASQLALWGLRDNKRTAKILGELHKWVCFFKETLEICLWRYFETPDKLSVLHRNPDVSALGLADAVRLRQIIINAIDPTGKFDLKYEPGIENPLSETLALGTYQNESALIEFKKYDPDADVMTSRRTTHQINILAALLSRSLSPEGHPSLRTLPCIGYYIDPSASQYSFIPPTLEPRPLSLLSAICAGEQNYRSTVKHRLQLAYNLALSMYQLHLVGWVHKSFRSENILFFPDTAKSQTEPAVPDALINQDNRDRYTEPWLCGFEYSRVITQESELATTDQEIRKNIYRHPARWNAPTQRFNPIHDIYALGTVLLEVGLWRPLVSLSKSGFARAGEIAQSPNKTAAAQAKEGVQLQFLQYAERRLPGTLGRSYCEVVELCLSGTYRGSAGRRGFDVDEHDEAALEKAFREKVVERLAKVASCI